ncbi:MAG TPA: GAF domain-containing protein, partial [Chloroflexota bacterium]|nr:GAF domain-containing protein [Chloroflexota bacterium]
LPSAGIAPQELVDFCDWLLDEEGDTADVESIAEDIDHARWHRLLVQAADDGFSQILRAVRREAALLAERSIPFQQDGAGGHAPDPLPDAVGRAATRLSALTITARRGSPELRALRAVKRKLLSELVAGYLEVTHPVGETERRLTAKVAELGALEKINSAVNSSLDLSQVLSQTVDVVAEVMHADVVAIFLYEDSGRLVLRATRGLNPAAVGQTSLALGEGITGWTALYGKPVALADAWCDQRFAYLPALMEEPYHGWLSVPIILFRANEGTNKLVGVINIQTRDAKEFSPSDVAFAETVAGQIATAIENARLYGLTDERLREKVQQFQALKRVTETLVSSLNVHQVLTAMARQAAMITGTDMAGIFELDEERGLLRIVAHHNLSEQYRRIEVTIGEGAVGLAVAERKPVVVLDAQSDPRLHSSPASRWVAEEGYRSMFSVPLISRNRVLGGISVYTHERHEFSSDQIDLLFTFANDAAIAMENARLYEEMRRSMEMKSTLLQEMHHRVKNNLQMMASLLRMQMRRTKSTEAAQTLTVTHAQIESLSAAHDLLSQESFGQTTVHELARRVADIAVADLLPRDKRIEVDVTGANVTFGSPAVTVGSANTTLLALILNELICNAILHGLERRQEGRITISSRELDDQGNEIELEVCDDGEGLPDGFALGRDAGLGLSIVQRLVTEQLKGSFEVGARPEG